MAHQERERDLTDEIRRLERLQRLAEKLHRYTGILSYLDIAEYIHTMLRKQKLLDSKPNLHLIMCDI